MRAVKNSLGVFLLGGGLYGLMFLVYRLSDPIRKIHDAEGRIPPFDYNELLKIPAMVFLLVIFFLFLAAWQGIKLLSLRKVPIAVLFIALGLLALGITFYKDRTIPKTRTELQNDIRYANCDCLPPATDYIVTAYVVSVGLLIVGIGTGSEREKTQAIIPTG